MNGKLLTPQTTNVVLTTKNVAEYLGVGLTSAYDLMHRPGFPKFKIGNRYKVSKIKLDEWIAAQSEPAAKGVLK